MSITVNTAPGAVSCPLCQCGDSELVRTEPEGRLVRCAHCEFLYVSPRPTAAELKALYDNEYFPADGLACCLSFRAPVFAQCLNRIESLVGHGRRLLDVGCGTGEFVDLARARGWDAFGIEESRTAADFARRNKNLPVYNTVLEATPFSPRSFDVITLLDVLEHLLDPQNEIKRIHGLLKSGGLAVIRVPNTRFHLTKARVCSFLRLSDSSLEMRYHLNHFTPGTLTSLLEDGGFDVLSIEVGAPETKAHAAWATPRAKRAYVRAASLLHAITSVNLGNIIVAYARKHV